MKNCIGCGKLFDENLSRCSRALYCDTGCRCRSKARRHYKRKGRGIGKCIRCGIEFKKSGYLQKYCSTKCSSDSQRKYLSIPDCLEEASRKLDKNIGYVRVYCPMHPHANTWGYVYEHRLIVEGLLGRYLDNKEHVHHKNGKRWDNRLENLQVLSSSEHSKIKK